MSRTGAELLFEVFSQRCERGSILVTTNLPFDEWTTVFGSECLTDALLDRLIYHVHILEMNGDSYRTQRWTGRDISHRIAVSYAPSNRTWRQSQALRQFEQPVSNPQAVRS